MQKMKLSELSHVKTRVREFGKSGQDHHPTQGGSFRSAALFWEVVSEPPLGQGTDPDTKGQNMRRKRKEDGETWEG